GLLGNAAQRTGTLSWAAGDAAPTTFTVAVLDDAVVDGNKSFSVALSAPTGGLVLGTPGTTTVTIFDNESAAESMLQFSAAKYLVSEASGPVVLTVTRTGSDFSAPVSVNYTMTAGSAVAGSDYTASSGTLSWASGDSTSRTITIAITNDAVAESPEQFTVTLSAVSPGAGLGTPAVATVLILDDDEPFPPLGGFPAGWTVPGTATAGWHVSNDPGAFDGAFALKTDTIDDSQTAQVQTTGTFPAGTVTFRVRVSSELGFDFMRFYVDGVKMGEWSGTANASIWQLASIPVSAGVHTFRWSYEKDASTTIGEDAAWIDAVVLP
ncbi:MAG: Calx-beta domain-containing protein, partial [Candidatus Binatia bacterium]